MKSLAQAAWIAAVLALGSTASVGWAADKQGQEGESAVRYQGTVVDALRERGARLTMLGVKGGVSGWLVELRDGDAYSLYVTPEGYSVAGLLYAPDGGLLTRTQLRDAGKSDTAAASGPVVKYPREKAKAGSSRVLQSRVAGDGSAEGRIATAAERRAAVEGKPVPAGLFARSAAAFGFTLGHRGKAVVVFADPGCEWSKTAVAELGRMALQGQFRLRVVPVGVLGAESARTAIRIASSADPALAWFARDVAAEHRAGGQWIEENNGIFEAWGEDSVPIVAWPAPQGGNLYRVGSLPDPVLWQQEVFGP